MTASAEPSGDLTITVLGSGTSAGVPMIGCDCDVCTSSDPRDNRLRPSVLLQFRGKTVLIDTTPDFRQQALRERIARLDAVLFTHAHADHIMGLDDVRPYNFRQRGPIPIYGSHDTIVAIRRSFPYIFAEHDHASFVPKIETHDFTEEPFELFGMLVTPVRLAHGRGVVYGFRVGDAAYLTDHSEIPPESRERLQNLDVLFLDALRYKPHPTHSTVDESLRTVEALRPRRAFFTHISHDIQHARLESRLPECVRLAYDGMKLQVALGQ